MKAEEDSGSGKSAEELAEYSTRSDQSPGPSKAEPEEDAGSCADITDDDVELSDIENASGNADVTSSL